MEEGKFIPITSQELEERINSILECWELFYNKMVNLYKEEMQVELPADYVVNAMALREMVKRVYQREDYFMRYHSNLKMSEYKEIGLDMFWLSKFKPFCVDGVGFDDKFAFDINFEFILFYMLNALEKVAKMQEKKFDSTKITKSLYDEMLYTLLFRDISKEAMGLIVELVANIVIYE